MTFDPTTAFLDSMKGSMDGGRVSYLNRGAVEQYKPEAGAVSLDILGFTVAKELPKGFPKGQRSPMLSYAIHGNVGPDNGSVVCPRSTLGPEHRCPICEAMHKLQMGGQDEAAKKLKPKSRQLFWIGAINGRFDGKVRLLDASTFLFGKALMSAYQLQMDEASQFWAPGSSGRSVRIAWEKESGGQGMSFMKAASVIFGTRKVVYTKDMLGEQLTDPFGMLNVLPYEEIRKLMLSDGPDDQGMDAEFDQMLQKPGKTQAAVDSDFDDPPPAATKRKAAAATEDSDFDEPAPTRRKAAAVEPESDFDDDPPPAPAKRKAPADVVEDIDEPEPEAPPAKTRRAGQAATTALDPDFEPDPAPAKKTAAKSKPKPVNDEDFDDLEPAPPKAAKKAAAPKSKQVADEFDDEL